jgi:hypothetical protein
MHTDERDEHFRNPQLSIDESCEPGSKVTILRDWQPRKQQVESRWTEAGMKIDESDPQDENASLLIPESVEPDSNATADSDWHPLKQFRWIVLTEAGMQTSIITSFWME